MCDLAETGDRRCARRAADEACSTIDRQTRLFAPKIEQAIVSPDRSVARDLIRDVDSRTVIVHPQPHTIENPWAYEGFNIFRGSLLGAYADLQQVADRREQIG